MDGDEEVPKLNRKRRRAQKFGKEDDGEAKGKKGTAGGSRGA